MMRRVPASPTLMLTNRMPVVEMPRLARGCHVPLRHPIEERPSCFLQTVRILSMILCDQIHGGRWDTLLAKQHLVVARSTNRKSSGKSLHRPRNPSLR